MKRALSWSFVYNWTQQGVTIILTFLLASILGPENYGLIAIAMTFIFFIQLVAGQPFVAVIIQRKDLTKKHLNSAFLVISLWSICMAALSFSLASTWSAFNDSAELTSIIEVLSPLIIVGATGIIPHGLLMRDLNFRRLTTLTIMTTLTGGLVGVYLALNGYGVWALVAQQWVSSVIGVTILWYTTKYKPTLSFDRECFVSMLPFAKGAFLNEMGGFAQHRADTALIGIFFGPAVVGLFQISNRMVQITVTLLTRSVTTFLLPYASRNQDDRGKIQTTIRNGLLVSTTLTIPALGIIAGLSHLILGLVGDEWVAAGLGLLFLCITGSVQSVTLLTPHFLQAIGLPMQGAAITWFNAILGFGAIICAAFLVVGETIALQIAWLTGTRSMIYLIFSLPISLIIFKREAGVSFAKVLNIVFAPVVAGITGALIGYGLVTSEALPNINAFLKLLIFGTAATFASGLVILVFAPSTRKLAFELGISSLKNTNIIHKKERK